MKAIVIEDQVLFRELIVSILESHFDLKVTDQCGDGESGLQTCLERRPDLVVLELKLKKLGGQSVFNRLKDLAPEIKVILVSAHFTPEIARACVDRGVNGLVTKDSSVKSLREAVDQVLKGMAYYSPEAYQMLKQPNDGRSREAIKKLTRRETDVLQMVGEGYSSREIAGSFNLSVRTIDAHRSNIMRKLKLRGATDMARLAMKLELVSQAD